MQDLSHSLRPLSLLHPVNHRLHPRRRPLPHPHHHLRPDRPQHLRQRHVARRRHRRARRRSEGVRRDVAPAGGHENQGAVVVDEEVREEAERVGGRAVVVTRPAPETRAADLAAGACEAGDFAVGVLPRGRAHGAVRVGDQHPVADHGDVAERHAGLRHAEGAGVHADEENGLVGREFAHVGVVDAPGVVQRVVSVGDGRFECEFV
mmetsp:Transcript_25877/g.64639  ORF Transcript_25877/g.64639 Transcript_25877/m.64639 type:complete len:206 (-) Transcript_25877:466-1083(-)